MIIEMQLLNKIKQTIDFTSKTKSLSNQIKSMSPRLNFDVKKLSKNLPKPLDEITNHPISLPSFFWVPFYSYHPYLSMQLF